MIKELQVNEKAYRAFSEWVDRNAHTYGITNDAEQDSFEMQLGVFLRFLDGHNIFCSVYRNNGVEFSYRVRRRDHYGVLDTHHDRFQAYRQCILIAFEVLEKQLNKEEL